MSELPAQMALLLLRVEVQLARYSQLVLLPAAGSGIPDRAVQHRDVTLMPLAVLQKRMLLHYITEWALRRHRSGKATATYLGDKARQAHY